MMCKIHADVAMWYYMGNVLSHERYFFVLFFLMFHLLDIFQKEIFRFFIYM